MKIYSLAFQSGDPIPAKYTCDGLNISVPLEWSDIPKNAKSLAIIMDDPDAPMITWVHWILYNISPTISGIAEKQPSIKNLSNVGVQGRNSWRKLGYGGPCPPSGTHRYFFKLYALDCVLESKTDFDKKSLVKAMQGHIIEKTEMYGVYQRER